MDSNALIYLKEWEQLEAVFGKFYMNMMFTNFVGYREVREENTFYEIKDSLCWLTVENTKD